MLTVTTPAPASGVADNWKGNNPFLFWDPTAHSGGSEFRKSDGMHFRRVYPKRTCDKSCTLDHAHEDVFNPMYDPWGHFWKKLVPYVILNYSALTSGGYGRRFIEPRRAEFTKLGQLGVNGRMTLGNARWLLMAGVFAVGFLGCEVGTSVRLDKGPSFSLDGSGRVVSFSVWGPRPGHKIATPLDAKSLLWKIEPMSSSPSGVMAVLLDIKYGSVPQGYAQIVPNNGAALPFAPGQIYYFAAETTGAPGGEGFFYMRSNGPILVNVPELCESSYVGDVKPVKCGTGEPYVEPSDLEEFVRVNRVQR